MFRAPLFRNQKSIFDGQEISPVRLQALVDGVFAIAMTLLVFNIKFPELVDSSSAKELWSAFQASIPAIFSFVISFVILGTFWVAHHTEFHYIKKLDHTLIWQNIFYLLMVSFLPFSAQLLGSYTFNQTAVIVYGAQLTMMVLFHYVIWQHARHHKNLVTDQTNDQIDRLVNLLAFFAAGAYLAAILLSFWSIPGSLVIYFLVPLPYIFGWIYRAV